MRKIKHLLSLTLAFAMLAGQAQAQPIDEYQTSNAYDDSSNGYLSAAIPLGALVIAAVLIATTNNHHHHSHHHHHHSSSSHSHL